MKKYIIALCSCLIVVTSCKKDTAPPVNYVLFSGKVTNTTQKRIIVVNSGDFRKDISIDELGSFKDTLAIDKKGYYTFVIGNETSSVYFAKGDDIHLTIDCSKFDESIAYSGAGAAKNNYLAKKYMLNEQFNSSESAMADLNNSAPAVFKKSINTQRKALLQLLASEKIQDTTFINDQTRFATYDYLYSAFKYMTYNPKPPKEDELKTLESLREALSKVDIDNAQDFDNSRAYMSLSRSIFQHDKSTTAFKDSIPYHKAFIDGVANLKSENIKNALLEEMAFKIAQGDPKSKDIYNELMKTSTDTSFQKRITASFDKMKLLAKGNTSPVFNYENHKGGKTSLEDLKGKFVYIDVWATWCAPCKQEIPYLKKVEAQYQGKNIAFVSISVDTKKDYEKWKNMVSEKELGGVQLFAENNWKSQFILDYGINGIPRFILIDPEGKIVDANAPRPSNPAILNLFKELKI